MNNHIKKTLVVAFCTLSTVSAWGVSANLVKAQEAYLNKNSREVMSYIGAAFREPRLSPTEVKNLEGLYQKTLNEDQGQTDLGWTIPNQILELKTAVEYMDNDGKKDYTLRVSGKTKQGTELQSFTLKKYPDFVVVDKEKSIGIFKQGLEGNESFFRARNRGQSMPIPSGVYLLDFSLTTGEKTSGWFVISDDMSSTATPEFVDIQSGQIFNSGTPQFSWKKFISPQHQAGERNQLVITVSPFFPNGEWGDAQWFFYEDESSKTTVNLATDAPSKPAQLPLNDGTYKAQVSHNDVKIIAPLKMLRSSKVARKIVIKK